MVGSNRCASAGENKSAITTAHPSFLLHPCTQSHHATPVVDTLPDATAEARLAEMLGCAAPTYQSNSAQNATSAVRESDCDPEMLKELEGWGMPHEFVLRSFKTFPYNHPSASYAILEHRKAVTKE